MISRMLNTRISQKSICKRTLLPPACVPLAPYLYHPCSVSLSVFISWFYLFSLFISWFCLVLEYCKRWRHPLIGFSCFFGILCFNQFIFVFPNMVLYACLTAEVHSSSVCSCRIKSLGLLWVLFQTARRFLDHAFI